MSGVEIIGIVAAALQIAELGSRLSVKLYTHYHKAKDADRAIHGLSRDVALTCNVMRQLGESLREDADARLCSPEAFNTAQEVLDECQDVLNDIDDAINPREGRPMQSRLRRVTQKFSEARRDSYLDVLGSNLERLKSTMLLMLSVIIYAGQVRGKKESNVLVQQRELIQTLLAEKTANEQRCDLLSMSKSTQPGYEIQYYYHLMRAVLLDVDAGQYRLNINRYRRIRAGVERIHLSERPYLQTMNEQVFSEYFNDPLFAFAGPNTAPYGGKSEPVSEDIKLSVSPVSFYQSRRDQGSSHQDSSYIPSQLCIPPPPPRYVQQNSMIPLPSPPPPNVRSAISFEERARNMSLWPPPPPPPSRPPLFNAPTSATYIPTPVRFGPGVKVPFFAIDDGTEIPRKAPSSDAMHASLGPSPEFTPTSKRETQHTSDLIAVWEGASSASSTETTSRPTGTKIYNFDTRDNSPDSFTEDLDSWMVVGEPKSSTKKCILATVDCKTYQLIDITNVDPAKSLRRAICQACRVTEFESCIFSTEIGQKEHIIELTDSKLNCLWREKADGAGSVKVFVQSDHKPSSQPRSRMVMDEKMLNSLDPRQAGIGADDNPRVSRGGIEDYILRWTVLGTDETTVPS